MSESKHAPLMALQQLEAFAALTPDAAQGLFGYASNARAYQERMAWAATTIRELCEALAVARDWIVKTEVDEQYDLEGEDIQSDLLERIDAALARVHGEAQAGKDEG